MTRTAAPRRDEKTGTWWFIVDLPTGPDGSRRQARRRGFPTKRAAQEALDKLRVSVTEGTVVEVSKLTVGDYFGKWIDTRTTTGLRPGTVASYRRVIRSYVVPAVGAVRLQALQAAHLDQLYGNLLARGLSPRTVRYTHTIVRKALGDAGRKGLVVRNVADLADPPSARSSQAPEMDFWTPAQLALFLDAASGDALYALYRLAAMSGMRRGEVCGLRWEDTDLDARTVRVRRQLGVVEGKLLFSEHPKSDSGRRTIDLDETTVAILRQHRRAQMEQRLLIGTGWQDHDLVFCGAAGEPLNPEYAAKHFDRLGRRLDVPRLRFHDLRHSHCAHLIAAGRNPREISRRLGHASVSFTLDRYGHLMPEAGAQAAEAVAALVDGTPKCHSVGGSPVARL